MGWDEDLFSLFDELEQQAEALADLQRAPELADRGRSEYQQVRLVSRLLASLDRPMTLGVVGVGTIAGRLDRVAETWVLLARESSGPGAYVPEWLVPVSAISAVHGAAERAVPEVAWSPIMRLSLGSPLRRLADAGERCMVWLRSGAAHELTILRVGEDFIEAVEGQSRRLLIATAQLAAVQSRE